jgi:ligand-binding sensor domain-containing protein
MLPERKSINRFGYSTSNCIKLLLLFFFLVAEKVVPAQQKYFRQYTTNDGLASNQLQSIYQDADGFIWFASFGGLSIYDGYHFTNYTAENKGASDNITTNFFARSNDETWVVTSSATDVFIKRKWVRTIPLNGFDKYASPLSNYLLTKDGRVLASRDNLIYEIKNAMPRRIASFEKGVTKFFETGNCFVIEDASADSVFLVNKSFSKILSRQKGKIFRDRYNRCWFLNKELHLLDTISLQKGVFKFSPLPAAFRKINVATGKITDLLADAHGFYWILLSGTGILRIDGEGNRRLFNINANSSGWENQELMEDAEGNIWVPGDDGAINFF